MRQAGSLMRFGGVPAAESLSGLSDLAVSSGRPSPTITGIVKVRVMESFGQSHGDRGGHGKDAVLLGEQPDDVPDDAALGGLFDGRQIAALDEGEILTRRRTRPSIRSIAGASGRTARSRSTGWPACGVERNSNFRPTGGPPLPTLTAATISCGGRLAGSVSRRFALACCFECAASAVPEEEPQPYRPSSAPATAATQPTREIRVDVFMTSVRNPSILI